MVMVREEMSSAPLSEQWRVMSRQRAHNITEMGRDALYWLRPVEDLVQDPAAATQLETMMNIMDRHPEWTFETVVPLPPHILAPQLTTDADKLTYFTETLAQREKVFAAFHERFGDTNTIALQIGDKAQVLGLRLRDDMSDGSLSFSIIDMDTELELGFIGLDYRSSDLVIINTVQEHDDVFVSNNEAVITRRTILAAGQEDANAAYRKSISNRQHKLRRWVSQNDGSHGYQIDGTRKAANPGVEELLVGSVLKTLQEIGVIDENTDIYVPKPENSHWGRNWSLGVQYAAWKQVQRNIADNPQIQRQTLQMLRWNKDLLTKEEQFATGEYYEQAQLLYRLLIRALEAKRVLPELSVNGKESSLYRYYLNTLVGSIADIDARRRAQEMADKFDETAQAEDKATEFMLLAGTLTQKTPAFLMQFNAYHSAFTNVTPQADFGAYRSILAGGILRKNYTKRLLIAA